MMKSFHDLDHYELLEVSRDAAPGELERAYTLLREAYKPGSLAAYSVLDEQEAADLRRQIEAAYDVLSNPERRRAYDASLSNGSEAPIAEASGVGVAGEAEADPSPALGGFEDLDDGDPDAPWDGARLRRSRLARGIDLVAIATVTKVNPSYLRFLEEDRFEALPAAVYVRGFVEAYARYLGLEARSVAASYIEGLQRGQDRQGKPRGRLLGGH